MDITLHPTIVVRYKAKSSQMGLRMLLAFLPFWAIWAPAIIIWLAMLIVKEARYFDLALISELIFFVCLIGVSIFSVYVCVQNKITITSDGIDFPKSSLFELRGRLNRKWKEIDGLNFVDSRLSGSDYMLSNAPDTMVLLFNDGGDLALELSAFEKEELQNFLLALQSYNATLPIEPPLAEMNLGISVENTARKALSFTQIWEDDMSSRFGSTVFVPLEPGSKLRDGMLEVLGQIAFGGLSAIYLAKKQGEQLCIVKEAVIPSSTDQVSRDKATEMFQRESRILMSLQHPRIAAVQDYFVEDNRHYMLLEYIDGVDLRKFVKEKGPQKESMVIRWTADIARILDYLHNQNPPIVHRDLTPDNLVLAADGSLTLIDFGAANAFLGTATGTLVGKQSYISPEQFRGKANPQSDLYSLGATIHYLLTGKDPEALSTSHPREVDAAISEGIDRLVADLTALENENRIKSAALVLDFCQQLGDKYRAAPRAGALL